MTLRALLISLLAPGLIWAQTSTASAPVPVGEEPAHHLTLENARLRAFRVEVPPHGATLLHQHDRDYIWVAIGDSKIVHAVPGKPEVHIEVPDATVRFTRGGFAHVARNESDRPFRNVTIEFLAPQTGGRNLCAQVLADQPMNCPGGAAALPTGQKGASTLAVFESDQTRLSLLTLGPGAAYAVESSNAPPVFVALEGTEAEAIVRIQTEGGAVGGGARPLHTSDVLGVPAKVPFEIRNPGKSPARFLVVETRS
jgi:mannose-6-phosphate isomerase-like protein (cupin superfamily)